MGLTDGRAIPAEEMPLYAIVEALTGLLLLRSIILYIPTLQKGYEGPFGGPLARPISAEGMGAALW